MPLLWIAGIDGGRGVAGIGKLALDKQKYASQYFDIQ